MNKKMNLNSNKVINLSKVIEEKKNCKKIYNNDEDFKEAKKEVIDDLKRKKFIFSSEVIETIFTDENNIKKISNYNEKSKIFNYKKSQYPDTSIFCYAICTMLNVLKNNKDFFNEVQVTEKINEYLCKNEDAAKLGLNFNQRIEFIESLNKKVAISVLNSKRDIIDLLNEKNIFTTCIKLGRTITAVVITGYITNNKEYYLEAINTGENEKIYIELDHFYNAYKNVDNKMFEENRKNLIYKTCLDLEDSFTYIVMSSVCGQKELDIRNTPINLKNKYCYIINSTRGYTVEFVRSTKTLKEAKEENYGIFPLKVNYEDKKIYVEIYLDASYILN